MLENIFP